MDREANADLLGNRQDRLEKDAIVVPHPVTVDRLGERLLRRQLVARERVPLADPRRVERGDPGAAPAPRLQVGPPDVGRHEVMTQDGDPRLGHVPDRRLVVVQLLVTARQPAQDLVPVAVRDVLDALDGEPGRLASRPEGEELIHAPEAVLHRQVARRMELDARQTELLGEGGDGVVEAFDVAEREPDHDWPPLPRGHGGGLLEHRLHLADEAFQGLAVERRG